ncbi:MAG: hypothetical protein ACK50A_11465 [Sphingobacteriaceae bacterium]
MKKVCVIIFLLLTAFAVKAQEAFTRTGLIKAMATISPSKMFGYNESYFYLHGNLEGYVNEKVSIAGEGYLFLGEQSKAPQSFKTLNNLFFGMNYHKVKGSADLYIGLQPGVAIGKLNTDSLKVPIAHVGVSPVFSAVSGVNYFVGNYFNFFIQLRYIAGEHNYDFHKSLSEIRLSAGLGFNIHTMNKK